jgi:hypothetical protein
MAAKAKPTGRPSDYSPKTATRICDELAHGKSLRRICEAEDMPSDRSVYRWLESNEAFRQQYARARADQADYYADEIIEISDDGSNDTYEDDEGNVKTNYDVIARSKLRVDSRKWYAGKLAPKKYGEMKQVEHSGTISLENLITADAD